MSEVGSGVSLLTAFAGGLASFVSPCVLPIVPGYLSFISGVNVAQFRATAAPSELVRKITVTSLVFVLGFSTVFVLLGAAATFIGYILQQYKRPLGMVGGALVIVLGLHTAGIIRIPFLLYEARAEMKDRPMGLLGAYLVGLAFGFGWTPCIGPILGTILLYASQQETVTEGVVLLSSYSAGLGVPFVISALAINRFFRASSRLTRHMKLVERVSGVLLILVGLLLVTDQLAVLARWFVKVFPFLSRIG
ncbi:MAG TPA: cytochrome c biogenesis protein CcdA [Vicinamibacteria bacterium]|nr:cytochrome c biogenesis protein CcdA [Vicinamibacteria bacterium]